MADTSSACLMVVQPHTRHSTNTTVRVTMITTATTGITTTKVMPIPPLDGVAVVVAAVVIAAVVIGAIVTKHDTPFTDWQVGARQTKGS